MIQNYYYHLLNLIVEDCSLLTLSLFDDLQNLKDIESFHCIVVSLFEL